MSDTVILALIGLASTITTVISTWLRGRASARNSAKSSIFQMILEDYIADSRGHLPTNYQNILSEYDNYHAKGGNSYLTQKVEDYKKWFLEQEKKHENSN